jgi:hypothetical protein
MFMQLLKLLEILTNFYKIVGSVSTTRISISNFIQSVTKIIGEK